VGGTAPSGPFLVWILLELAVPSGAETPEKKVASTPHGGLEFPSTAWITDDPDF
jgi:hypothetical protein